MRYTLCLIELPCPACPALSSLHSPALSCPVLPALPCPPCPPLARPAPPPALPWPALPCLPTVICPLLPSALLCQIPACSAYAGPFQVLICLLQAAERLYYIYQTLLDTSRALKAAGLEGEQAQQEAADNCQVRPVSMLKCTLRLMHCWSVREHAQAPSRQP